MNSLQQVKPVKVIPSKSLAASDANWSGINKPIKGTTEDGKKVVFKHNSLGIFARAYPPEHGREQDVKEIVASQIMAKYFQVPTVTYQEAYIEEKGKKLEGIFSDLREDILEEYLDKGEKKVRARTLENTPTSEIKKPDVAVAQSIVKGWMGDWDIIANDSNVWVTKDGTPLAADFGFSLDKGITATVLRIPNANMKVMQAFAKRENVEPVVEKIKKFSDDEIKQMVHWAGATYIHDWTPQMEKEISSTLIHNRDLLRKKNPFAQYYKGLHPLLHPPLHKTTFPIVFFVPDARCPKIWKHPEIVVDSLKALSIMYGHPRMAKLFEKMEKKIMTAQDGKKGQAAPHPIPQTAPQPSASQQSKQQPDPVAQQHPKPQQPAAEEHPKSQPQAA